MEGFFYVLIAFFAAKFPLGESANFSNSIGKYTYRQDENKLHSCEALFMALAEDYVISRCLTLISHLYSSEEMTYFSSPHTNK